MGLLHLVVWISILGLTVGLMDYPEPRIVIVGPTGAGKSSLANALLGCDPNEKGCTFVTCGSMNSCTKETSVGTGRWLGTGENFTVVDTPGFGDSDGQDNTLIEEMIKVLDEDLGYTNIILLLFDGTTSKFTTGLQNMLRQMSSLFGSAWWDNLVIGASRWEYSQFMIDKRQVNCDIYGDPSEQCKNEDWFMSEISAQIQDKLNVKKNFTFTFVHSHSQTKVGLMDPVQQEHFQAQAKILWNAATTRDSVFEFKTIDDVLEENHFLKKENRKLKFLFEQNIATLYSLVRENKESINGNGEKLLSNEQTFVVKTNEMKGELKTVVDRIVGTEGRILANEQSITINKKIIKSSMEKIKGDLQHVVDKTAGYERGINSNMEKVASMKEDVKNAVMRINGNEKGINNNIYVINTMKEDLKDTVNKISGNEVKILNNENKIKSILEKTNTIKGELKEAVNRISGNEKGVNSNVHNISKMKGDLKNAADRIAENEGNIANNEKRIISHEHQITSNLEKINTIKGNLKSAVDRIDGNYAEILSNKVALTTREKEIKNNMEKSNLMKDNLKKAVEQINGNELTITTNEHGIRNRMEQMEKDLTTMVDNLKLAPIGTIIAWVSRVTRDGSFTPIPDGWHRCDGTAIPHPSIWEGKLTPDLNNGKRFLRGGPDNHMLTMEDDQLQDHEHIFNDPGHTHTYTINYVGGSGGWGPEYVDTNADRFNAEKTGISNSNKTSITVGKVASSYRRGTETRPKNMNVIFIMRVF